MVIWSYCLRNKPSLQDLLEVQRHFELPSPALVEKDWHVARALAVIAAVDSGPFRLVFNGGTALSRAYRLIQRMSEDIDLKIIPDGQPSRQAFRHLRDIITKALLEAGFQFDPENPLYRESGNASRYTLFRLPYAPIVAGEGTLRPEIQIETAVWPLRRPTVEQPVISFLAEAFNDPPEVATISCVALAEMGAEKFVALTRRVGAELADAGGPRDPTLVRHIYDLHMIRKYYDLNEVARLAREIMLADVAAYGHQFPAYRKDPVAETLRVVTSLVADPSFSRRYAGFQRDMVYGQHTNFETAIASVVALAEQVKEIGDARTPG
jgi:predicted nucleotidyltransferase component of viral defense system